MASAKWFWPMLGIYTILYCSNRLGFVYQPLIQYYLADLLAVPVMATISLWLMRYCLQQKDLVLLKWQLILIVVLCSVCFELCLPRFMPRYVSDPIDVLMYILGGLFFNQVMNK